MAITEPYDPRMEYRIRESVKHVCRVYTRNTSQVIRELEVISVGIDFDEQRIPAVQATVLAVAPRSQALLDELDPRVHAARLIIEAGYGFPNEPDDMAVLGDLVIRSRAVNRPENTITLTLQSEECLLLDGAPGQRGIWDSADGAVVVIQDLISSVIPNPQFVFRPGVDRTGPPYEIVGTDLFEMIRTAQDTIGVQVFNDGTFQNWTFAPQAALAPEAAADLRTGPAGSVIDASTDLTRDGDWANKVVVYFGDESRDENYYYGSAQITSGPMAVTNANIKVYTEQREAGGNQANANEVARNILLRRMTYGRSFVMTAVAAYWLRPRMTVTVQLPLGDTEYHLVSAVAFDPVNGTMAVKTRKPEGTPTISLGA